MNEEIPIWRIKYLPKRLKDIVGRKEIIDRLQKIIQEGNFPHMLFVGAEGVGKSTIARLFSKEFLGEFHDANFKFIFADLPLTAEERAQARTESYVSTSRIGSIAGKTITMPAFIQIKVKPFVELKALGDIPFKILVVKNFEALESNQQGFRRLMEIYGSNCRMILITTKISGIIDPILSRCQLFLIPQINLENFREFILEIADKENLEIKDEIIEILHRLSRGNLSHALDYLQLASLGSTMIDSNVLFETYKNYQNMIPKELLMTALKGDFKKVRDSSREIISKYKITLRELLLQLLAEVHKLPLSRTAKFEIINMIAKADFKAIDGQDDDIQLSALLSKICAFSENL
ncbi:MAG: hypothetical protein ACTSUN_08140 [Promethearchaeota archaeon]